MSVPEVPSSPLRDLLDRFYRTGADGLLVEPGSGIRVRRGEKVEHLDASPVTADYWDALVTQLTTAKNGLVMASAGWFRVAIEGTALVASSLPSRMTFQHHDQTPDAINGAPA